MTASSPCFRVMQRRDACTARWSATAFASTRYSATDGRAARAAPSQARAPARPARHRLRPAALAPGSDLITDPDCSRIGGRCRRRGRLVRRRRLPEVHTQHGVQRRPAVHRAPGSLGPTSARVPAPRGSATGCAGSEDVGRRSTDVVHAGGDRLGQPCRAPSTATTTCGGCPRPTTTTRATSTASSRTGRSSLPHRPGTDQPEPRRPGLSRLRPRGAGRRADTTGKRPRASFARRELLYARAAPPIHRAAGDRAPARVLSRGQLARRHGAGRRRDRPGCAPPGRTASAMSRRSSLRARLPRLRQGDTLNLYDTGALAARRPGPRDGRIDRAGPLAVTRHDLRADLRHQLGRGVRHARHDPFGAAGSYDEFDVNSHTFGLIATAGLYHRAHPHAARSTGFAAGQRTGCSAGTPGASAAMVGIGSHVPALHAAPGRQPERHASTDPPRRRRRGGQRSQRRGQFDGGLGGFQNGMVHCPSGGKDRSPASTARAADTSTTSAPGRPTNPPST